MFLLSDIKLNFNIKTLKVVSSKNNLGFSMSVIGGVNDQCCSEGPSNHFLTAARVHALSVRLVV